MLKKLITFALVFCVLAAPLSATARDILDLEPDAWSYPYVAYMQDRGIMQSDGGLSHHDVFTTRGEFVYYLWRAAGCPDIWTAAPTFKDVSPDIEYYDAVEWAVHHKITTGTSADTFSPQNLLTRQEAFTFLYRALTFFGLYIGDIQADNNINDFYDYENVSTWARTPMNVLCELGIVNGSDGYLVPLRDVANGETAAILFRTLALTGTLPHAGMAPGYDDIGFLLYNETPGDIYSVSVMPAYTDGDGISLLLTGGKLAPWGVQYLSFPSDFEYYNEPLWVIKVSGSLGEYTINYDPFVPNEVLYIDVYWNDDTGFYNYFVENIY